MRSRLALSLLGLTLTAGLPQTARAADWPMWGRDASRNMMSEETGLPDSFDPGKPLAGSNETDMATTKNVKWTVRLGSQAYGNPVVSGGKVLVGTNNENPRDPKYAGDRSVVMCFDEQTGDFLWQLPIPKLGAGKVSDWEYIGICSSPIVVGNRAYLVSNRCELICLDVDGQANGNDGAVQDEAQYLAGPGKPPIEQGPKDGDLIWRMDMREELGAFPHNITSCSPLVVGENVYTATSNGVDWSHTYIPSPKAPALISADKETGELTGEEDSGISKRLLHANWSSPSAGTVNGKEQVFFGGGDGYCYGFEPIAQANEDGDLLFKEIWRFDCNPPHYREVDGKPVRYSDPKGPSEIITTPVFHNGRVYVAIGQDPEHGEGVGHLVCIDASQTSDSTKTAKVWSSELVQRSISTPSIADGLLYIADYSGKIYCFNADTGEHYWTHATGSHIWGSTLVADGKVYCGTEDGDLTILAAGKEAKLINKIHFDSPIYSTPIVANGVLFVATHTQLYALQK